MTLQSAHLTRFPVPFSLEDYDAAAREIEGMLLRLPGLVAVYRTGSVSAPGISDLDRIAVVRGTHAVPEIWSKLSARTRAVAMHTPLLFDEETFSRHRWFADLEPLELVHGRAVELEQRPYPEYAERLIATEALVGVALKLRKHSVTGRVKVRPILCELHNMRRDLELGRIGRSEAPAAWALSDRVRKLREEWWTLSEQGRVDGMRDLLGSAIRATAEALQHIGGADLRNAPRKVRLTGTWRGVTLVPGQLKDQRTRYATHLSARVGPLAELRWRLVGRSVRVPVGVISLLCAASDHVDGFRLERRLLVRRYDDFLRASPGYSGVGMARVFIGDE